jgi:hypothetical protein
MLSMMDDILAPLLPDNVAKMYEIFSLLIQDPVAAVGLVDDIIARMLQLTSPFDYHNPDTRQALSVVLRCHSAVATSHAQTYLTRVVPHLEHMLGLFSSLSEAYANNPETILLTLKSDILRPFAKVFKRFIDLRGIESLVCPLTDAVIADFERFPAARVPQVVFLFGRLVRNYPTVVESSLQSIDDRIFGPLFDALEAQADDPNLTSAFLEILGFLSSRPSIVHMNLDRVFASLLLGCERFEEKLRLLAIVGVDHLFSLLPRNMPAPKWDEFCKAYAFPALSVALRVLLDATMKATFPSNVFLVLTLLRLPIVKQRVGDVARILASICPTKPPTEIEELTMGMMDACQDDLVRFMHNLLVSMNQVSAFDPDLNRRDKEAIFDEMNRRAQEPVRDVAEEEERLAMEIAGFSIGRR